MNTLLDAYSDSARKQFSDVEGRLTKTEKIIQDRMNGKTKLMLRISLVGTLAWAFAFILWFAAIIIYSIFLSNIAIDMMLIITTLLFFPLLLLMFVDGYLDNIYYGKIIHQHKQIGYLKKQIAIGLNYIAPNYDVFLNAREYGWNCNLEPSKSIPNEIKTIENTLVKTELRKKGVIHTIKNVLYFASVVAVTIVNCVALFPLGNSIMTYVSGSNVSLTVLFILNIIALVLSLVPEIILAKLLWSMTNCGVTNITLFILILGPILYLALIIVGTIATMMLLAVLAIAIAIAVFAAVIGLFIIMLGGG